MVNQGTSYKRPRPADVAAPAPASAALPPAFAAADGPAAAAAATTTASSVMAADDDPRIQRLHDAAAILSSVGLADTQDVRAINLLNKLTADGELEILLESTAPALLDAIADALDRHNAPMLHVLQARLAKQKPASSPTSHPPGHGDGRGPPPSQQHPAKSNTINQPPHATNPPLPPPWLDVSERHVTQQNPGPLVLGLLSILRNLSYIVANEEILARHTPVLTHLVSLLPCAYQDDNTVPTGGRWPQSSGTKTPNKGNGGEIGTCVTDLLLALSPRLDVAGLAMDEDEQLAAEGVPEDSLMALAPPKLRAQYIESHHQGPEHQDYINLIRCLLRLLMDLLTYPAAATAAAAAAAVGGGGGGGGEDRQGVLRCLELLARLMSNHEANAQFVARHASPAFLVRLHEFFYVPLQGLDSMEGPAAAAAAAAAATFPGGKPRPRYAMHGMQQQYQDGSGGGELDVEVRGWSLEVLAALCAVSRTMEGDGGTEGGLREGGKEGGFHDGNDDQKNVVVRLKKHVAGLVRSLVLLLDLPTAAPLAGRLLATLARGGMEGRTESESQKRLLTHYVFRPGGEVAAELLWSVFLAPPDEEEEEEEEEEGEEGEEEEEEEEDGMDQ